MVESASYQKPKVKCAWKMVVLVTGLTPGKGEVLIPLSE